MPPKKPEKPDPHGRVRMLGERDEQVIVTLTIDQITEQDAKARQLRNAAEKLEDEAKSSAASYKARIKELEQLERSARAKASTGRAEVDVRIQEWLTRSNEVIRVYAESGEQIGPPRTARIAELQEALDFDKSETDSAGGDANPFGAG